MVSASMPLKYPTLGVNARIFLGKITEHYAFLTISYSNSLKKVKCFFGKILLNKDTSFEHAGREKKMRTKNQQVGSA